MNFIPGTDADSGVPPMTIKAPSTLLPCPFCGSEGRLTTNTQAAMSWVACPSCGLEAPSETGTSADDAVHYWNTRTSPIIDREALLEELAGRMRHQAKLLLGHLPVLSPFLHFTKRQKALYLAGYSVSAASGLLVEAADFLTAWNTRASPVIEREAVLEEAAKVADAVWDEAVRNIESYTTNSLSWRNQASIADRIRIAIRALKSPVGDDRGEANDG